MVNLKSCSIEKFIRYAQSKKVYAFGAGRFMRWFCGDNKRYDFEKVIFSITDNDSDKWGKDYVINECAIPIISVNNFINNIGKDDIILISALSYQNIIEQLNKIETLDGIDCFILPDIEDDYIVPDLKEKIKAAKENEPQIPKKIHYGWFGSKEIPDDLKKCMESWSKFCPDYEIIRWDENNYDVTKHEYMNRAYKAKKWSRVNNYARLDIIYEHGGIYLDNDVEIIRSLDDLLFHQAFMAFESGGHVNPGSGFGAKKHSEIIRILRDDYNNRDFSDDLIDMGLTTSPIYQSEVLEKQGLKLDNSFQHVNGLAIYPKDFFSPLNWMTKKMKITENTYTIHHYDGSWVNKMEDANVIY